MNNKKIVEEILKESSSVWFIREGLLNEIKYFDNDIESATKPTDSIKVPIFAIEDLPTWENLEDFIFYLLSKQCKIPQKTKIMLIKFPNRRNLIIGATEQSVPNEITEFINDLKNSLKFGFPCDKFSTSSYFSLDIKIS